MRSLAALLLLAGASPEVPLFEDTGAKAGLTIKVVSGDPAEKKYIIESIGGGLAALNVGFVAVRSATSGFYLIICALV